MALPKSKKLLAAGIMACWLCCGAWPSKAGAEELSHETVTDARHSSARIKYQVGAEAYRQQRYADAVQFFLQADALAPSAALSFNIALAYDGLRDERSALRWYRDYLRRHPKAKNATEVRARVSERSAALAAVGVQQLSVFSTPPGASVHVDQRKVGVTPFTGEFSPGKHEVTLQLESHQSHEVEVFLPERTAQDLSVRLQPVPAPNPGHQRQSSSTGGVRSGPKERQFGSIPWITTGVGAASLAAAAGFEVARRSEESQAKTAQTQLEFQAHLDAMQTQRTTARVLLGVGGALVVTGGILFIVNLKSTPGTEVGLGCGGKGCGLVARGTFQ